jgi:hypothetical protein
MLVSTSVLHCHQTDFHPWQPRRAKSQCRNGADTGHPPCLARTAAPGRPAQEGGGQREDYRSIPSESVRADETDFTYERDHQPKPRIGPWQSEVDRFLVANEGKPSRERLTLIRIYE